MSPDHASLILESLNAGCDLPTALKGARVERLAFAAYCADNREYERACDEALRQARKEKSDREAAERRAQFVAIANAEVAPVETPRKPARSNKGAANDIDDDPETGDRWAIARQSAAAIEPGHIGTLLWIDARCQAAGMHALDAWWVDTLRRFYASGKLVLAARVGLRGAKSVTICRSLVNDALFTVRDLDPSTVGVIPIMSADRTEATDRFHTIIAILRACGVASSKKGEEFEVSPGGLGITYTSTTLPSGGGVIKVKDSQDHDIEFRIYPARITGAVGYTAVAGFCDEVDLWPVDLGVSADEVAQRSDKGKANPGDVVLDRLLERFTTTMATAHLYIVSASYRGEDSAHHRKIAKGDTSIQMVARLGEKGAARDTAARRALSSLIASEDPRLLSEADPQSTDVGAWVTNPAAPIETCYALSQERIGPMLGRYGGRPDESGAGGVFSAFVLPDDERAFAPVDTVMGVAPPTEGVMWGRVVVGIDAAGCLRVIDDASGSDAFDVSRYAYSLAASHGASVLAVAKPSEALLSAYLSAAYMGGVAVPAPVAAIDVHDGQVLRTTHLVALYERGRLTHGLGQDALKGDLRRFTGEDRAPRVEALAAAVARLVACYPFLGVEQGPAPKAPAPIRGMLESPTGVRMSVQATDGSVRRMG